jgi:hypothetical protein
MVLSLSLVKVQNMYVNDENSDSFSQSRFSPCPSGKLSCSRTVPAAREPSTAAAEAEAVVEGEEELFVVVSKVHVQARRGFAPAKCDHGPLPLPRTAGRRRRRARGGQLSDEIEGR